MLTRSTAASSATDSSDKPDHQLLILLAKREAIFELIQGIYDSSSNVDSNAEARERFLAESASIDTLRSDFIRLLDDYNSRLLIVNPAAKPDYKCLVSFEQLYSRIKRLQVQRSPLSAVDSVVTPVTLNKAKPRLPPIELVAFAGDIRKWPVFYACFKSTIHDNPTLTDAEKLYYLIGKLSGKAESLCAGITPCAENYDLILQTLIDKFEDKRMVASAYLNQMFDFQPISSTSASNFDLFHEQFINAVRALNNLKIENLGDLILVHIALKKLDSGTVRDFELSVGSKVPTFDDLESFIKNRAKVFERTKSAAASPITSKNTSTNKVDRIRPKESYIAKQPPKYHAYYVNTVDSATTKCLCKNITHQHLFKCPDFHKMTPEERFKIAKERNACINCLSIKHRVSYCKSDTNCRSCKSRHHSLLHFESGLKPAPHAGAGAAAQARSHAIVDKASPASGSAPSERTDVALCATSIAALKQSPLSEPVHNEQCTVLLATAQIAVYDSTGSRHLLRALLDSGSQSHFITKQACDLLGIQSHNLGRTIIKGFGGAEKIIDSSSVNLEFYSRFDKNIKFNISPLVVDQITDSLPSAVIDTSVLSHLHDLPLADETFGTPNKIDILIGAPLFVHLLLPDVTHPSDDTQAPQALRTVLGYIVMGSVPTLFSRQPLTCCLVQEQGNENLIKRFWELEEPPSAPPVLRPADVECEDFYKSSTTRDPTSGRYTVGLPFSEDVYSLGRSYETARRRFLCLEKKLEASPSLRIAYDGVIKEYLEKDYITPAPPDMSDDSCPIYVIPHHGVIREDKTSTRLRIVLDASCKTSSGTSLNNILHHGPNLQGDLFQILLNFRLFAVAMTADCRQQFLQIAIRECDRRYQCILYRFNPQDPLTLFQFKRVCFGLASSVYHAMRTVRQLIDDDGAKYPLASDIATSSIYMDDIVYSVKNEEEGIAASKQLIELFKGAQWDLVKWNSNSRCVLDSIPATHKLSTEVEFDKSVHHKILGLHWSANYDAFYYKIKPPADEQCTKRSILSTIARLWDVMGFVAPTVLYAKLLIKQLWHLNLDWDDTPPPHIVNVWKQFCAELPALNELRIPRHGGVFSKSIVTLVGFSDASEHAYGGVVYLHVSSDSGNTVRLVCAKSKVAPMKPLTIARLELCGIVLLSKLLRTVLNNYAHRLPITTYAFTDSKVALYWLKSSPHRWQTFVSNRVVQITDNIRADHFYHVSGTENPADCLSRGITPQNLISHPLWLHGPSWVILDPCQWPLRDLDGQPVENMPEQKVMYHNVCTPVTECTIYDLALCISAWSKLLRILVYVFTFAKLLTRRVTIAVTADQLQLAENKLLLALQIKYFAKEFDNLRKNQSGSRAFNKLRPFIDNNGLIRVGGRLVSSGLDYTQIHPVILPRNDHIVNLLIDYYHLKYLHAGPELLMSLLRQRFWILSARRIVRQRVHMCNTCFRLNPRPTYPLMADLPECRTRQSVKAFTHTGCDYAGPIAYTPIRRRGVRSEKAYLCLFTCLTTRAVHIEVATDLSTPSFLAALKRFLARRGPVQVMHSDNATNFKGAAAYIRDLYKFLNDEYRPKLEQVLAESRLRWSYISPRSPHKGGTWESMIKVVKTHLYRVIGQQLLSYEELCTVLTQVECLLNSRPLTVLSSDPAEPSALTPSHFLHTAPLCSLPAPEVDSDNLSLLQRHSLLDKMVQSFWQRWRMEYLHGLQVRQKWNTLSTPITPGVVVVVIEDNVPSLAWPLAIVDKVHPSKDGVVRTCTIRYASGTTLLRPAVRICPIPRQ